MSKIEGSCLCGNVHYAGETEVLMTAICHCTYCQKQSGSAFSTNIVVPKDTVKVEGELSRYDDTGDSGQPIHSHFCPGCGCVIYNVADIIPDLMIFKAGTLDDSSWVKPNMELYCSSIQSWVDLGDAMQKFPKMMES